MQDRYQSRLPPQGYLLRALLDLTSVLTPFFRFFGASFFNNVGSEGFLYLSTWTYVFDDADAAIQAANSDLHITH